MKLLFTLITVLGISTLFAQEYKGLAQGQPAQKNYLTTVPYTFKRDKMIVQASINNKTYNFLFDTGAPMAITAKVAKELGITSVNKLQIQDANGASDSLAVVNLNNIKIGTVTFNGVPTLVVDKLGPLECLNIDGFIGSNVLRNSIVQILPGNKTIIITDSPKSLKLSRKNSVKMFVEPGQASPLVSISLLTDKMDADETVLIDTGMSGFYDLSTAVYKNAQQYDLFKTLAQATGFYTLGLYGNSKSELQYQVKLPELAIGKFGFKNITATTTSDLRSRVGIELLKHGNITLDYLNGRFYFEPFGDKKSVDLAEKSWPFKPVVKDDKIIIGIVWDAALAGKIDAGDEILSFGNLNFNGMDVCQKLLSDFKAVADNVALVIKDAETGEVRTLQVSKE
ncbi:hypothetical protein FMM05_07525 [Flavobacterium zepuense]|uniref:Aspartyl protease n=1 Tax=Flavobacterium zepuense TaxID=2593302 RepID=A0A552V3X3_9FLAO|nr:retropepsin-like aspartic protease [Flavobacterium zepuense]TRW25149.1 hypothetical protein FMM05_07525 [Flavobacterium zepuense]